jgi:hypothetical protein
MIEMILQQTVMANLAQYMPLLQPLPTQFGVVSYNMYPLVILAVMIDALIVAIWYMAGAILGNRGIKESAKGEAIQVVGTAIIAGIVLGSLLLFGYIYYNSVQGTQTVPTVLAPSSVLQICDSLGYAPGSASSLDFVTKAITTRFLSQPPPGSASYTQNPSVCDIVAETARGEGLTGTGGDGTVLVDYPLASTAVVTASLASGVTDNLNDLFVTDAYLSFLQKLKATVAVCFGTAGSCAGAPFFGVPPIPFTVPYDTYIELSWPPLGGLDMITKSLSALGNVLYLALAVLIAELLFTNIFLFIWPFLIFVGIVLRGLFFTRKIGGLFIAIAIGAVFIYPTVFGLEYLTANNTQLIQQTPVTFCGSNLYYEYYTNFFVLPSVSGIAMDCNSWPWQGLTGTEVLDIAAINEPYFWGATLVDSIVSEVTNPNFNGNPFASAPQNPQQFINALSQTGVPYATFGSYAGGVDQNGVGIYSGGEGLVFGIAEVYGIIGVAAFFLPIINVVITLAAIIGLSGLLGGDTQLAGITRFI